MSKHITVGELIKKLQKLPPDTKVIIRNDYFYNEGYYYVTSVTAFTDERQEEKQVWLESNYKSIAKGWEE